MNGFGKHLTLQGNGAVHDVGLRVEDTTLQSS